MATSFLRKKKRRDRLARWIITIGGMAVIASVIAILVLIVKVTLPLFQAPETRLLAAFSLPAAGSQAEPPLMIGMDEYLETGYGVDRQGVITFFGPGGKVLARKVLAPPARPGAALRGVESHGPALLSLLWDDGTLTLVQITFAPVFGEGGRRTIAPATEILHHFPAGDASEAEPVQGLARRADDGALTGVLLLADNRLAVTKEITATNIFGEESTESVAYVIADLPEPITALTLSGNGDFLYAGTAAGSLLRWRLGPKEAERLDQVKANADGRAVTALAMVFGSESLAVGDAAGRLSTWMAVRPEPNAPAKVLHRIHDLHPHPAEITGIIPSRRDKSLLSLNRQGGIHLDHMTTERHLLSVAAASPARVANLAPRGNGLVAVDEAGEVRLWQIDNPHPEVSLRTLFGKVWYEGYDQPAFVWQSSASSDDAEPKLSITPLIFGTVKGTIYAMLLAVPLAIFGAVYISQFASARMQGFIKPVVEVMASIPSVVIGFLIALWLAPIIEDWIVSLMLSMVLVPGFFVLFMLEWQLAQRWAPFRHFRKGNEFLVLMPVLLLAVAASWYLGPMVEKLLFGGDFKQWLFTGLGARYDQRNSIIIAFGLGFTVIPIIFTMTEDAISNVPPSLAAASLALGASRWQTVWRVMLPSASPGIFAAVMIGFGRVVGETMIVLMATGNTPIMDWSIFNGMRTLSANIAVEIPEAPVGGTLYRVLFLTAVILFGLTFVLNTGAEMVRERLRRKYGRH